MRSARKPSSSVERFLVFVLAGLTAITLLLVVPAFASELRLDHLHPSLPVVSLRPLADARARIADELGAEFSVPIQQMAGELRKAGAKTFNAVLHEVDPQSGSAATQTPTPTEPESNEAGLPLSSTPAPTERERDSGGGNTSTPLPSATPSSTQEVTQDPNVTVLPSPTVDLLETSVVETATALALPKKTKLPPPTKTPGPSYTQTSTSAPTEQMPSLTPTQKIVATATLICAVTSPGCQTAPAPSLTPTDVPSPTLAPTLTPLPTTAPTNTTLPTPVPTHSGPVPAFPGAEGWGAGSVGGRGGRVIEVNNLNDSGPGSLRAAAEASGPRIVVFRVAGVITLESPIRIKEPYITVAGQTAPGTGITLVGERLMISTHDVIIRYLSWRGGGKSFIALRPWHDLHDVIVDHCSASWGTDDMIDIWFGPDASPDMRNITVQNCLIAEPLASHSTAMMVGAELTDSIDYLEHLHHISVHHNLFSNSDHRNPRIKALYSEVINNVVFNWGHRIGGSERASEVDWIANYFKAGPMSYSYLRHLSVRYGDWVKFPPASLYIAENVAPERGYSDPNSDNWWMLWEYAGPSEGDVISDDHRRASPLDPAPFSVTLQSPFSAYDSVLSTVGANARLNSSGNWVTVQDPVDIRLVSDVRNGTGPSHSSEIDRPGNIGPVDPGSPYDDSDHDGMANEWERIYCLDPNDPSDGPKDADGDGYTNIEEFLNGTTPIPSDRCGN